MKEITVLELNEKIKNGENPQIVDVREAAEFAGGRIKNSKLLPLGQITARIGEIDNSKPLYVFCRTGNRSGQTQNKLQNLGF